MILGGLIVLFLSPFFALLGFPGFLFIIFVPIIIGTLKELGDYYGWWKHDGNNFRQAMNDISEWTFGGMVFTLFITVTKYFVQ